MLNRIAIALTLFLAILSVGCARAPMSAQINRFDHQLQPPYTKTFIKDGETYVSYENVNYKISTALFEYQSIIVLPLEIFNHTASNIWLDEYAVSLYDGRDLKPIKMLTRTDLQAARSKIGGGGSSGGIEQQLIESTLNAIMEAANVTTKNTMIKSIDIAIDNYFEFRPIYAGEKRGGILCFLVDFKMEYPITLMVKLKGEEIRLKFMPQMKKEVKT